MSRIAYLGMMVLPVCFWHVGKSVVSLTSPVLNQELKQAAIVTPQNYNLGSTSYLIAARDDKIQDCVRLGNCKD
jgi:hypothetical protein